MVGFVDADLAGHLLDDLVEEWISVDEEEIGFLASEEGDEVAGVSQAYECLVRVNDGLAVAEAISEDLEMVLGHAPTQVGVRELLQIHEILGSLSISSQKMPLLNKRILQNISTLLK